MVRKGRVISMKSNAKNVASRMARKANRLNTAERLALQQVLRIGYNYAQSIAPEQTGALRQALEWLTNPTNTKEGWIISRQPNRADSRGRVPYHLWMHGIGKYNTSNLIHSGMPMYMFVTSKMLKSVFKERVSTSISRSIRL